MIKEKLIDLDDKQFKLLKEILESYIPGKMVWAYGSRVTWKAQETSDLDLVVFDCNSSEIFELKEAMEESNLLVSVDIMDWESISEDFKENIKKKYVPIQKKINIDSWQEIKLGNAPIEIIDGDRGRNYPHNTDLYEKEYCIFLNTKNITNTGFSFLNTNCITKEKDESLGKGKLKRNDLVLTTRGTIGNVAFYDEKIHFDNIRINSGMVIVRPISIDPQFNYQLFKCLKKDFLNSASGTAQPQLPIYSLKEIQVVIPPLLQQKAIAEILSSIDDKIDLLHRQNKTLENLAQTLFYKWFIENTGNAIEFGKLSEVAKISYGKAEYQQKNSGEYPIYGAGGEIGTSQNFDFQEQKLIIGCRGTCGNLTITKPFSSITHNSLIVEPKEIFSINSLFLALKFASVEQVITGSTQPQITITNLKKLELVLPEKDKLIQFEKIAKPTFKKMASNLSEIHTMRKINDVLLPKLMLNELYIML